MITRPATSFGFGLVLLLTVALGACGGNGSEPLTLEEYFDRLEELDNQVEEQTNPLLERLGSEDLDEARGALAEVGPLTGEFADSLADLDPPAEVQSAHGDAVDAAREFQGAFEDIIEESQGVETREELSALFSSEEFAAADQQFTESCVALQTIADDNNIEVDLECEDEA